MIEKEVHIKELYDLKHRNDNEIHLHYDYETHLNNKMYSRMMLRNPRLYGYLGQLKTPMIWMLESVLVVRNFWNYSVDKYYNRHNN